MAKYLEISGALKKEILDGKYEKEGKIPTEYELVSRFDVSRQTIRQAISCLKNEGYLYQVQGSGTYISKISQEKRKNGNSTMTVTVICTYISDYIFPSIIRGIESILTNNGITINLVATGNRVDKERKILQKILSEPNIDGIIVEGTKTGFPNPNIELYREIESIGIPLIFLHCSYPELTNSITVGMEEKDGGRYGIKSLISLGCSKFGAVFKSDDRQGLLRYSGFCDGLLDSGFSLDSSIVRWYTTEDLEKGNMSFINRMIGDFEGINGIVSYNDQITFSIINAYNSANKKLPLIFSFDRSLISNAFPSVVITIGHRKEELGILAASKMINMLEGKKEESQFLDWII